MSRLIVVSNRVNPPDKNGSAGGLAVALTAALKEYSGIWFGWSGETVPEFTGQLNIRKIDEVTVATVDLEESDFQEYYNGYANKALWPLFHYRIDLAAYDRTFGEGYERVNRLFAETLRPLIEPDDLIWVHDYHMIPLARELRSLGVENPIGFFLHIPWPAPQLLTTLPQHRRLVESLFDYDLVGLQTDDSVWALESYVLGEAGGRQVGGGVVEAFGKRTRIKAFPIGLDTENFQALVRTPLAERTYDRMAAHTVFRSLLVGVERLDYSKGLEERLRGVARFLEDNPDMRRDMLYLQIAPTSRGEVEAYQELRMRVEAQVGRINATYADMDWAPIRYVNHTHTREELAGIYRAAKAALVTPLRDGMNLVAKEYVAAQNPEDPGVLILSRFAGAAQQMKAALIINPFSHEEIAEAIKRAIGMDREERIARWQTLMEGVRKDDVTAWRDAFVESLKAARGPATGLIEDRSDGGRQGQAGEVPRDAGLQGDFRAERRSFRSEDDEAPVRHPEARGDAPPL